MVNEEKKLSIWAGTLPNISYEQFLEEWMEEKYDTVGTTTIFKTYAWSTLLGHFRNSLKVVPFLKVISSAVIASNIALKIPRFFPYVVTFSEELNKILNMKAGHE